MRRYRAGAFVALIIAAIAVLWAMNGGAGAAGNVLGRGQTITVASNVTGIPSAGEALPGTWTTTACAHVSFFVDGSQVKVTPEVAGLPGQVAPVVSDWSTMNIGAVQDTHGDAVAVPSVAFTVTPQGPTPVLNHLYLFCGR